MNRKYDVSVILCTYNRAHWLGDAVRSLLRQRTNKRFTYEILVVDNASTDDTQQVFATVAEESGVPIRRVTETRPSLSAARNCGIREAHGEWLAFFDDDERAGEDWVLELLAIAEEKQARVSGGAVHLILEEDETTQLSPAMSKLLAPGGRAKSVCRFTPRNALNGGNQMFHHSVFEEIGLYQESCTEGGEDTELFMRLYESGIDAWFNPRAIVKHLVPQYRTTPGYLYWMSLRQGWAKARQDIENWGLFRAGLLSAARLGMAAFRTLGLLKASVLGDSDAQLRHRCQLCRTQGYARGVLRAIAPQLFPQQDFLSRIEFRGERQQFA